jgi:hypothetical protein
MVPAPLPRGLDGRVRLRLRPLGRREHQEGFGKKLCAGHASVRPARGHASARAGLPAGTPVLRAGAHLGVRAQSRVAVLVQAHQLLRVEAEALGDRVARLLRLRHVLPVRREETLLCPRRRHDPPQPVWPVDVQGQSPALLRWPSPRCSVRRKTFRLHGPLFFFSQFCVETRRLPCLHTYT